MTPATNPHLTEFAVSAEVTLRLETVVYAASETDAQLLAITECRAHGEIASYRTHAEKKL